MVITNMPMDKMSAFGSINESLNKMSSGPSLEKKLPRSDWAEMLINLLRASSELFDITHHTYLEGSNPKDKTVVLIVNPAEPVGIQTLLDNFYRDSLEPLLKHPRAKALNEWIESNGEGNWYQKLGTYLLKLPIRSVRDILSLVYNVISSAIYGVIHPIKGMFLAAEFIIRLLDALKQPETYVILGAGAIGSACGRCAMTGLFLPAAVSAAIGALFLTAGITYDVIKGSRDPKKSSLVWKNLDLIAQSFTTGALIGLATGYFSKRVVTEKVTTTTTISPTQEDAFSQFHKFLEKNGYSLDDVFKSEFHAEEQKVVWSWWNTPENLPPGSWHGAHPTTPWINKWWTFSTMDVAQVQAVTETVSSVTVGVFENTLLDQAASAAVNISSIV